MNVAKHSRLRRHIETRIILDAPADRVWAALTGDWAWSPDFRLELGALAPGRRLWLRLRLYRLPLRVVATLARAEPEVELSWLGGPPGLLRAKHYLELRAVPGAPDKTELVHGEHFQGVLAPLLWPSLEPQLARLYPQINAALALELE